MHYVCNVGVIFKLDKESLHESLRLSRGDLAVRQTNMVHANAFGTAPLADGCHYWMVNIDSFKGENAFIAVGKCSISTIVSWYAFSCEFKKHGGVYNWGISDTESKIAIILNIPEIWWPAKRKLKLSCSEIKRVRKKLSDDTTGHA